MNPKQPKEIQPPSTQPAEDPASSSERIGLSAQTQAAIDSWGQPSTQHVETNQQAVFTQNMMPAAKSRSRLVVIVVILVLGIGLAGVITASILSSQKTDTKKLFSDALGNSLGLKSFELKATTSVESSESTLSAKVDFSDAKDPKLSYAVSDLPGKGYTFESYSKLKNSYFKFTSSDPADNKLLPKNVINKWVGSDKNVEYSYSLYSILTDASSVLLGNLIIGNYSDVDKTQLTELISNSNIYQFKDGDVSKQNSGTTEFFVYNITIDYEKLVELNKTTGKILGISDEAINQSIDLNINKDQKAQIVIDKNNSRIVKATFEHLGEKLVYEYSNFNASLNLQEPKAEITEGEFFKFIEYSLDDQGNIKGQVTPQQEAARSRDVERKSDMRAIQSKLAEYYALNSKYPISLGEASLNLEDNYCQAPGANGNCDNPDYTYKAFITGFDISGLTNFSASNSIAANGTATDADTYILFTNSMEAQTANREFYQVSSSF